MQNSFFRFFFVMSIIFWHFFFAKGDFTVLRHSSLIWHIHHQLLWEILKVRSHSLDRSSKILGWFLRKFVKKVLSILFKEFVCLFLIPLEIPRVFFFTFLQRFLQIQWFFYWNITSKIALDATSAFFLINLRVPHVKVHGKIFSNFLFLWFFLVNFIGNFCGTSFESFTGNPFRFYFLTDFSQKFRWKLLRLFLWKFNEQLHLKRLGKFL